MVALVSRYLLPTAGVLLALAVAFILWQQARLAETETRAISAEISAASARDAIRILQENAANVSRIEASIRSIADRVEATNTLLEEQAPPNVLADPDLLCFPDGAIR